MTLTTQEWAADDPHIDIKWGGRPETAEGIASSLLATLGALAEHGDPYDQSWQYAPEVMAELRPVPTSQPEATAFVESQVRRDDAGQPWPETGYHMLVHTPEPVVANVQVRPGHQEGSSRRPVNQVLLDWRVTHADQGEVDALYASIAQHAEQMVTDLAEIWRPDVATLTSSAIITATKKLVPFSWPRLGAVTWLPGSLYAIPDQVPGASVHRHGSDTILTVGTREQPSLRVDDVIAVYAYLKDHGHLHPAPATQS